MTGIVERLSCSHCNAPLEYNPGEIIVTCRYCGSSNVIETGVAFTLEHSMLVNNFDSESVRNLVKEWMKSGFLKPKDLKKRSKITEINLSYLPFWIVPIEASSHYRGLFERAGPSIEKKANIQKSYNWVVLGRKASEFPTREFDVPLKGKIPFSISKIGSEARVLNSEVDENEAKDIAKQEVEAHHEFLAKQEVDRIIEIKTTVQIGDAVYIHAPIWFITYEYKGNSYRLVIDASNGEVIKGDIPPVEEFKLF